VSPRLDVDSTADTAEPDDGDVVAPELMARVRQIQIRTHRLVNEVLSGAYRSTFRGSGVEFEEVRPYQPGDDVRSIDWHRTAKSDQPYIKTYVEERELVLQFLVDTSSSMDFGSGECTKREVAAQFCALLSYVALRHHDQVGLTLFDSETTLHLPPRKGVGAVARVVREVIAPRPPHGATDYRDVLEHEARTLRRRTLLFLVSDFASLERADVPPPAWSDVLTGLSMRHDVIAVRVVDPLEEELPAAGPIALRDVETGRHYEVDGRSRAVREHWAAAAAERRKAFGVHMQRSRVETIELSTVEEVIDPVIRFFRGRRRRRGGGASNGGAG